jgi:hypothetical protein
VAGRPKSGNRDARLASRRSDGKSQPSPVEADPIMVTMPKTKAPIAEFVICRHPCKGRF